MAKKYRAKYSGEVYNTKQEAIEDNRAYFNDVEYRFDIKGTKVKKPKEYKIPFIESKKRTLTNAGLATGAVISENMLDTIAKYADAAGLPVKTALGLAVKESTLGNPTDDTSVYKILSPKRAAFFRKAGTGQNINFGVDINPRNLVNFYIDDTNPYYESIQYALEKAGYNKPGNNFNEQQYRNLLTGGERYADKKAKEYEQQYGDNHVLQNAFTFYKNNPTKYNPGQPNYQQLVNKRADEVWGSPEIQAWYKRSLENGGK